MPIIPQNNLSPIWSHLRADQSERWHRGERVSVEHYLTQYPDLSKDTDALIDLIHSEIARRQESGEVPSLDEYLQRFPQYADVLRRSWPPTDTTLTRPHVPDDASDPTFSKARTRGAVHGLALKNLSLPGLELFEILGEGGMGVVYRARDVRLDQPRAIKVIRAGPFAGRDAQDRFGREARAIARLDHPGVVRIHSLEEHREVLYICMEYLEGGCLRNRLKKGLLKVREAADLVRRMALAVQHAHENKVLHRDLKPANVLLTLDGSPKIGDFGLAKLLDADDELTQAGAVMGTPDYMAPEQAEGRHEDVSERTDIWSLGAVLYECLTGNPPFKAAGRNSTMERVRHEAPAAMGQARAGIPPALEAICLKCLEKRPERRFSSANELAGELQNWLDGKATRVRASGSNRGLRQYRLAAAVLVFVLIGGLAAATVLRPNAPPDRGREAKPPLLPGIWHPLLEREPVALRWPTDGNPTFNGYDPKTHFLHLFSEEHALVALGETSESRYRLRLNFQQTPLIGNVGLFVGYRIDPNTNWQSYEIVELISEVTAKEGKRYRLKWKSILQVGILAYPQQMDTTRYISPPFHLGLGEQHLELAVGPKGLEEISFGDSTFDIDDQPITDRPTPSEFKGRFGIYLENANCIIRDARFLFSQEP